MENESTVSDQQNAEQDLNSPASDLTSKQRGELAELAFMHKAAGLGFGVAKPWGDSQQYDFILSRGQQLWRVQVKSTWGVGGRGYQVNAHRKSGRQQIAYTSKEIDVLVAYIVPQAAWYVIPAEAVQGITILYLYPCGACRSPGRFEKYREAWHLMMNTAG
jgi:PD-(D/E)XK endonuclease